MQCMCVWERERESVCVYERVTLSLFPSVSDKQNAKTEQKMVQENKMIFHDNLVNGKIFK